METFTLEQLSYIAEIVGVILVVVSLVYLSIQVRQNTEQMEIRGLQEAITKYVETNARATIDTINAKNFRMGLNNYSSLSRDEQASFHCKMHLHLSGFHQCLFLHRKGQLNYDDFLPIEINLLKLLSCQGTKKWWNEFKHMIPEHLSLYIEKRLEEEENHLKSWIDDLDWARND